MRRRKSILIATVCILFVSAAAVWGETDNGFYSIAGFMPYFSAVRADAAYLINSYMKA